MEFGRIKSSLELWVMIWKTKNLPSGCSDLKIIKTFQTSIISLKGSSIRVKLPVLELRIPKGRIRITYDHNSSHGDQSDQNKHYIIDYIWTLAMMGKHWFEN